MARIVMVGRALLCFFMHSVVACTSIQYVYPVDTRAWLRE